MPAEQIGRLRVGTPVEFKVSRHRPAAHRQDRADQPRGRPAPPGRSGSTWTSRTPTQQLAAGLFAEGRVATDTKRAVAVPVTAVDSRGTTPVLHLLKAGRVKEVPVKLGVRDKVAEMVEVLSGLADGDTVLLGSAQGVTEGNRVRVLQEEAGR